MEDIRTATGRALDALGRFAGVARQQGEPDITYRYRITEELRKTMQPFEGVRIGMDTKHVKLGPFEYSRAGFVTMVSIGRLVVYERVGDRRSFAPYLKPKGT